MATKKKQARRGGFSVKPKVGVKSKRPYVTTVLSNEDYDRLSQLSLELDTSKAEIIRQMINHCLDDMGVE